MVRKVGISTLFLLLISLSGSTAGLNAAVAAGSDMITPPGSDVFSASGRTGLVVTGSDQEKNDQDSGGEKAKKSRKSRTYADVIRGRHMKPPVKTPPKKPKYKEWNEVVKDAKPFEGLFKSYQDREDVFFEIRGDQLDKPYLAVLSYSKGIGSHFVLGGLPIDNVMFDFHRVEDHVLVRRLNTRFRAPGDSALTRAIDLSYGTSILFSLKIESEDEDEGKFLVQMNPVFLSDFSDIAYTLQQRLRKPVRLEQSKGYFEKLKGFPRNIEVEAVLTYSPGDRLGLNLPSVPDPRYLEIGVHYSICELPEEPMKPRLADDRIGYFLTPFKDFTRDTEESFMVHYINRWRLEKKDPEAALSEPKQPIVFYIDHTIPERYRKYVAEGVEAWQEAFEEAGFKMAIIAKEAPDDPDFDPEDARYNTIRWIVSDSPSFSAIGPSRVDPRTGEIIDADVLLEANMMAGFHRAYRRYGNPEAIAAIDPFWKFNNPAAQEAEDAAEPALREEDLQWSCHLGDCISEGGAYLRLALFDRGMIETGMDVPEEYIGEALRYVVTHEVGHTLGLRHNFKSSTATPFDKLNDRRVVERNGLTGSVMDYASPNISDDPDYQGYYYSPTVGTYDRWAIKWGYMEVPGSSPKAEAETLLAIARDAYKTENTYGTDEDTYPAGALDPDCNIWDLGSEPLRYAQKHFRQATQILAGGRLEERLCENGQNFVALRSAVETLFIQKYIAFGLAVKYIGGQYTERPHQGDPGDRLPLKPLTADKQREALGFLIEHAFSTDSYALPPALLNKLADNKLGDWENPFYIYGRRFDFPLIIWAGAIQNAMMARLLHPMLLQRVLEAECKMDEPFRLSELFGTLTTAIWLDEPAPAGRLAIIERNLQRQYLRYLVQMVVQPILGMPDDAIALARLNLNRIRQKIEKTLERSGLSDENRAHLMESRARIDRALEAGLQAGF
jgi:hypothetical protein